MTQPALDFTSLPISGRAPRQRHSSHSGAVQAMSHRGALSVAYLTLIRTAGPLSDQAAAKALGVEVSSVNSTRAGLGALVEDAGTYEVKTWANGGTTKRTQWKAAP